MYKVFTFPSWPWKPPSKFKWRWAALLWGWLESWSFETVRVETADGKVIRVLRK
jgi:hypothetical protein